LALINDLLLMAGWFLDTVFVTPHAFLAYALTVAITLLIRYQRAAGELEQTSRRLRQRTAELQLSHNELSEVRDELIQQKRLAAVGELAASIAHEVRNPLAVIVNATAGLRRSGMRGQDRTTLLQIIEEETSRLAGLVTDLLRFARPFNLAPAQVSLPELVKRAGRMVGDKYRVALGLSDDPRLTMIRADAGLLRLALENLIENACQAMPRGGKIHICSSDDRLDGVHCVRVAVRDEGPGMQPHVQKRALDPFFTTRSTGTGLGLAIAKRIVEAHGGKIKIESRPGSATTVALWIPLEQRPSGGRPTMSDHPRPASTGRN